MGLASNFCGSGVQSNKRRGQVKALKQKNKLPRPKKRQKTLDGTFSEGRADEGDDVCKACKRLMMNPNFKSFGHHPTCKRNKDYSKTKGGTISKMELLSRQFDEERLKELNAKPKGAELHTTSIKKTQADMNKFHAPRKASISQTAADSDDHDLKINPFSIEVLKEKINNYMLNPPPAVKKSKIHVPMVIAAAFEAVLLGHQIGCKKKDSNELLDGPSPQKN